MRLARGLGAWTRLWKHWETLAVRWIVRVHLFVAARATRVAFTLRWEAPCIRAHRTIINNVTNTGANT